MRVEPSDAQIAPISLANPTLRAWKLLSTYLLISATLMGTRKRGREGPSYSSRTDRRCAVVVAPTTVFGRIEEIPDARSLPQELGVHIHPEVDTCPLAGSLFQSRNQQ